VSKKPAPKKSATRKSTAKKSAGKKSAAKKSAAKKKTAAKKKPAPKKSATKRCGPQRRRPQEKQRSKRPPPGKPPRERPRRTTLPLCDLRHWPRPEVATISRPVRAIRQSGSCPRQMRTDRPISGPCLGERIRRRRDRSHRAGASIAPKFSCRVVAAASFLPRADRLCRRTASNGVASRRWPRTPLCRIRAARKVRARPLGAPHASPC
jgi:hypothetical protein